MEKSSKKNLHSLEKKINRTKIDELILSKAGSSTEQKKELVLNISNGNNGGSKSRMKPMQHGIYRSAIRCMNLSERTTEIDYSNNKRIKTNLNGLSPVKFRTQSVQVI